MAPPIVPMPIGTASGLPQVSGLDLERGLRFFAGQVDVYREALGDFARFYGPGLVSVEAYLARPSAQGLAQARRDVHALGGAAAALGATGIEAQVRAIDAASRQPSPGELVHQLGTLRGELATLVDALRAQLGGR